MANKKGGVNVKVLMEDMDRYFAFCHQQKKQIKQVSLTREQYEAFVKKTGEKKYHGVEITSQ
jgi:hypothetical protein